MKKLLFIFLTVVITGLGPLFSFAVEQPAAPKVVAYYFHGTFRCYSCTMIEGYSREAIESNFKDALASGKLEFKAVNVEERDNRHFIDDYQLYTKSLILSLVKDGKEIKSKNLTKIWEYARNKQRFFDYVTEEVSNFLKETQ
jgi:hypothetical protein